MSRGGGFVPSCGDRGMKPAQWASAWLLRDERVRPRVSWDLRVWGFIQVAIGTHSLPRTAAEHQQAVVSRPLRQHRARNRERHASLSRAGRLLTRTEASVLTLLPAGTEAGFGFLS